MVRKRHVAAKHKATKRKNSKTPFFVIGVVVLTIIIIAIYLLNQQGTSTPSVVVATVNGDPITQLEIDALFNRLPDQMRVAGAKAILVNQTIDERLLLANAKEKGITVDSVTVDEEFKALLIRNGYNETGFREFLASRGISYEDIKRDFNEQLIIFKLINQTVIVNIDVSDTEINNYYNVNQISGYNLTLTNETKKQIRTILLNQKIAAGVQFFIKQVREAAEIKYILDPQ